MYKNNNIMLTNQQASTLLSICWLTMGDWGANYTGFQVPVATRMNYVCAQQEAQGFRTRCVLSTGDNFYEQGVFGLPPAELRQGTPQDESDEQRAYRHHLLDLTKKARWISDTKWKTTYYDVYRRPEFTLLRNIPFVLALGNHDYYGIPEAQVAYTYVDPQKLWHMPRNYYTYDITPSPNTKNNSTNDSSGQITKPVRIIVIDTVMLCKRGRARNAHKQWISETLSKARKEAGCIVVMGHYPIHSEGSHCAHELNINANNGMSDNNINAGINSNMENGTLERSISKISKPRTIKRWLISTMLDNRVDLYLSGHNHNLEYCAIRDFKGRVLHCITSGSAAKLSKPPSFSTCSFSLSNMYNLLSGGVANSGGATGNASFVNPIFGYGFVEHKYVGDSIVNTFHYVLPQRGATYKDMIRGNKQLAWKTAVVKTAVNSKT